MSKKKPRKSNRKPKTPVFPSLHKKPIKKRLEYMQKPTGLKHLERLLNEGVGLKSIFVYHFLVPYIPLKELRRDYPVVAEVYDRYKKQLKDKRKDEQKAYRLILGFDKTTKEGIIALTSDNPEELWQSEYIQNYLRFYRLDPEYYKANYLKDLHYRGVYYLSNLYAIAYCTLTDKGRVQTIPVSPESDPEQT